jgi:hypothetical protein
VVAIDFGFFFARVIRFYSLGYEGGLKLPIRAFWRLNSEIDRIEADQDRRTLRLLLAVNSGETAQGMLKELNERIGEVVKSQNVLARTAEHQAGIEELRGMQHQRIGGR